MARRSCECILRDDGIYHAILYDRLRLTIDEYFAHSRRIFDTTPPEQRVNFLIDTRPSGGQIPVLNYITEKSREMNALYPNRPALGVAILIEMSVFSRILDLSLNLFLRRNDRMRLFNTTDFDTAVAWLKSL